MNAMDIMAYDGSSGFNSRYLAIGRRCHVCEHCNPRPAIIEPEGVFA